MKQRPPPYEAGTPHGLGVVFLSVSVFHGHLIRAPWRAYQNSLAKITKTINL